MTSKVLNQTLRLQRLLQPHTSYFIMGMQFSSRGLKIKHRAETINLLNFL